MRISRKFKEIYLSRLGRFADKDYNLNPKNLFDFMGRPTFVIYETVNRYGHERAIFAEEKIQNLNQDDTALFVAQVNAVIERDGNAEFFRLYSEADPDVFLQGTIKAGEPGDMVVDSVKFKKGTELNIDINFDGYGDLSRLPQVLAEG